MSGFVRNDARLVDICALSRPRIRGKDSVDELIRRICTAAMYAPFF
jgi:hypothetical protein